MNKKAILVLIVFLSLTGMVFGGSGDSMSIGGVVPLVLELTLDPTSYNADDLDLDSADTLDVTATIADITIDTNSSAGWDLVVMSANDSSLINQETDAIAYTAVYVRGVTGTSTAAAAQSLTAAGVVLTSDGDRTPAGTGEVGVINIVYDQSTTYAAGYYSDLLTVTLRAK